MALKKFLNVYNGDAIGDTLNHNTAELYAAVMGFKTPWFVDSVNGSDTLNDGMTADTPFKTITAAEAAASSGDVIYMRGTFTEAVVTAKTLSFIGVGGTLGQCVWMESAPGDVLLTLTGTDCLVQNIRFRAPTTGGIAISMTNSDYTVIRDCYFQGRADSLQAIYIAGGAGWKILDNTFAYFNTATTGCAILGHSTTVMPAGCEIARNVFHSNLRHIKCSMRQSYVHDNMFQLIGLKPDNSALTATVSCDVYGEIAGAQFNTVTKNIMQGTYSISGGYKPGANDNWFGNLCNGISATGVTAEGMTTIVPA